MASITPPNSNGVLAQRKFKTLASINCYSLSSKDEGIAQNRHTTYSIILEGSCQLS